MTALGNVFIWIKKNPWIGLVVILLFILFVVFTLGTGLIVAVFYFMRQDAKQKREIKTLTSTISMQEKEIESLESSIKTLEANMAKAVGDEEERKKLSDGIETDLQARLKQYGITDSSLRRQNEELQESLNKYATEANEYTTIITYIGKGSSMDDSEKRLLNELLSKHNLRPYEDKKESSGSLIEEVKEKSEEPKRKIQEIISQPRNQVIINASNILSKESKPDPITGVKKSNWKQWYINVKGTSENFANDLKSLIRNFISPENRSFATKFSTFKYSFSDSYVSSGSTLDGLSNKFLSAIERMDKEKAFDAFVDIADIMKRVSMHPDTQSLGPTEKFATYKYFGNTILAYCLLIANLIGEAMEGVEGALYYTKRFNGLISRQDIFSSYMRFFVFEYERCYLSPIKYNEWIDNALRDSNGDGYKKAVLNNIKEFLPDGESPESFIQWYKEKK